MVSTGAIKASRGILNLEPILLNGQAFRWIKAETGAFYGVAHSRLWRLEREDEESVRWLVLARSSKTTVDKDETVLRKYLQMDVSISDLYDHWKKADENFERFLLDEKLRGIRILEQEPLECLLSFICSANNNIKRISKLVNQLAVLYGDRLDSIEDEQEFEKISSLHPPLAHAFPSLDQFRLDGMEQQLRQDGFGYRAGYIRNTIEKLHQEGGVDSLELQKSVLTKDAKAFLMGFAGIGPKVADCIMLMSLGYAAVVPLDVHMWNITRSLFMPALPAKAVTSRYEEVASFYLSKFGTHAGWAQAVLFNAQLGKTEKKAAPEEMKEEVEKKREKK
ncbi:hypothetical protein PMAYCL1PPCAC_04329 [Pristionchus mayeri]|uniref:DNA-(apurinic or apyrimidinic site) lyase n=1 Tax=Pristionchus mayeri TaxID=1317129 RepID=A0AAN4Z6C1_9BILA|nr:hypothetical protein PMAYCL1PPCAC_04329 [Pristionchus mayeri]